MANMRNGISMSFMWLRKRNLRQLPFSSRNRCACVSFSLLIGMQFFVVCMIIFAIFGTTSSREFMSIRNIHEPQIKLNLCVRQKFDRKNDSAELQISFLSRHGSLLPQAYLGGHTPALANTTKILKAITLSKFCKGQLAKSGPKYAIFRDAVLAERKLYLPSTINCSLMTAKPLSTRFNPGQRSSPEIEVMVVPSAGTFEDFEAYNICCHERVYEPSVLFSFINWPQYGHAMFNGVSLLWQIFNGPLKEAGKNVRLYAYGDSIDRGQRQQAQEQLPFFDVQTLKPLMSMFSHQPVRGLASLLLQSERHPVCFSYLLVGLSGDLDHYNFRAPLKEWREFSKAVKNHFGVMDPPREMLHDHNYLQRLAPKDALQSSDPEKELGKIIKIKFSDLPERPRLTILNRKSNRAIVNVMELEQIAAESGYFRRTEVIYAEDMDLEEQVQVMGITDVLFGIDGTGLMNGIFLPEGGVVVHVRPYGCKEFLSGKGINFDRLWAANPGRVIRHESGDKNTSRFPTDPGVVPDLAFSHNSPQHYRFSFILRQDTVVDPVAFRCILDTSHKLLHGIPIDWPSHLACTRTVFF